MEAEEFRKWRKSLRYTQPVAGEKFGVTRATIQNWESGITPVPKMAELASLQLTRKWKQSPEFGPVSLVYAEEKIWTEATESNEVSDQVFVQCEVYASNELAIRQCLRLRNEGKFRTFFIIDEADEIIWTTTDLLTQIEERQKLQKNSDAC